MGGQGQGDGVLDSKRVTTPAGAALYPLDWRPRALDAERQNTSDERVMSVDEAKAAYPGQWILMRVTRTDEFDAPTHGIVVATGPTSAGIPPKVRKIFSSPNMPRERHVMFTGHTRIDPRTAYVKLLVEAVSSEALRERKQS